MVADRAGQLERRLARGALQAVVSVVLARADDAARAGAVARALLAKSNPVLVAAKTESRRQGVEEGQGDGLAEGRRDGLAEGLRRAIQSACAFGAIELTEERRAFLSTLDAAGLETLLAHLETTRRWP